MLWWEIIITIWWSIGFIVSLAIEIRNLSDDNAVNHGTLGTYIFLMCMIKNKSKFNMIGKFTIIPVYTILAALCIIPFYSFFAALIIVFVGPYYMAKNVKPAFKYIFMDKNYNRIG